MITNAIALEACLRAGRTVSLFAGFESADHDLRWAITETGETVRKTALRALIARGAVETIQRDLVGEPMQYGAAR